MKGPPCKKDGVLCDKRHSACQDSCTEFLIWKEEKHQEHRFNFQQNRVPLISHNSERQYWRNLRRKNQERNRGK